MKNRYLLAAAIAGSALFGVGPSDVYAAPPPAKAAAPATAPSERVLPELNFNGVAFDDMIDFLRDVSDARLVVVRDPGVPAGYPTVSLRLKQVTLAQIFEVLQVAYPEVEVTEVGNDQANLIRVFKIHAPPNADAAPGDVDVRPQVRVYHLTAMVRSLAESDPQNQGLFPNGLFGGGGGGDGGGGQAPGDTKPEDTAKARAAALKTSLNQVLSLMKATLAQSPDPNAPAPTLQVHEETQTLIFKGWPEQRRAVEDVLAALDPEGARVRKELEEAKGAAVDATNRAQAAEQKAESARKDAASRAADAERLQIRMEALTQQLDEARKRAAVTEDRFQVERQSMAAQLREAEAKLAELAQRQPEKPSK